MKAFDLKRVTAPPPPPEPKLCVACKGFRAECVVPVGEGSVPMCWLCAHHVVDHECALHDAATAECECLPHEVYPGRPAPTVDELIQERMRFQHGDVEVTVRSGGQYSGRVNGKTVRVWQDASGRKSSMCKCGHPMRLHDEHLACGKCDCERFNRAAINFHDKG